jgi:sugar (pentulose or hexulose) kinase
MPWTGRSANASRVSASEIARVAAIGVAGPQRGLVLLDEANRIIRPAKLAGDFGEAPGR